MFIYVLLLACVFGLMLLEKLMFSARMRSQCYQTIAIDESDNNGSLSWSSHQKRKLSYPMKLALLVVYAFTALRYGVGWDYLAYYDTIHYGITSNIMFSGEYATTFLVDLSRRLGVTNIYFAVNAFICLFFTSRAIREYSRDYWLSIILFLCFPLFFLNSLSVIRFFSALALVFYGFRYIERRNFMAYCLIVLLAGMFHKSAFITLVFYFLYDMKFSASKLAIILALSPILSTVINRLVIKHLPRYAPYAQATNRQEGTKSILVFIVVGIIALILKERITARDRVANAYYNIYFMGLITYLMFFTQGTMGHRLSLYGTVFSLLLIPKILSLLKGSRVRILTKLIIYAMCIVMFLLTIYIGADTYVPYRTILDIR